MGFIQATPSLAMTSGTSGSAVFGSNVTLGNLLVCMVDGGAAGGSGTIADTQGNTWTQIFLENSASTNVLQAWYAIAKSTGANTVTVSSLANALNAVLAAEYSGVSTLDQVAHTHGTTGSTFSSPSVTTTHANEILIGIYGDSGGQAGSPAAPTGFTARNGYSIAGQYYGGLTNKVVGSIGTYAAAGITQNGSTNWGAAIATFYGSGIIVPNVVGLTQAAATAALTGAGFVVGTVTSAYSTTTPVVGEVASYSPNDLLVPGTAVNLVISLGAGAPFSVTIVRDTFVRANSGTLGANWTTISDSTDTGTIGITSNAAAPQVLAANSAAFYNAAVFRPDQYSECIINSSAFGTNTHGGGPIVRASSANGGSYYRMFVNLLGGVVACQKLVNGSFSGVVTGTGAAVAGSLARLEVVGSVLTGYIDGVQSFQITDTDIATGAPGICAYQATSSPTTAINSWEGGDLVWTRRGTAIPVQGQGSFEPSVIYEANPKILTANADGKIWKMWYCNGWTTSTIYYGESNDGITWTQYSSNPVISDGANNPGHGVVFKNGSTYYGYFDNDTTSAQAFFNRWTSSDGLAWINTGVSLPVGGAGTWDEGGVFNPCIWIQNSTWYMLYNGRTLGGVQYKMGLATSPDGITWTKYAGNPVLQTAGTAAEGKTLVIDGSTYYLYGFQSPTGNLPTDDAMWSSTDLHTWVACTKNPMYERVLAIEGANLAVGQIGDPYLVELNGTTYMWYDATNAQASGHFVIQVATVPYTLLQITGMIFGANIIYGNVGIAGITVNYTGPSSGSVFSDVNGNYVIPVQSNGTYVVTPSAPPTTFSPVSQTAVVNSADVALGNSAPFTPSAGSIAGNVVKANVLVECVSDHFDSSKTQIFTTLSDSSGNYSFSNLPAGRYYISAWVSGFVYRLQALVVVDGVNANTDINLTPTAVNSWNGS
jgi:hypothetical protein